MGYIWIYNYLINIFTLLKFIHHINFKIIYLKYKYNQLMIFLLKTFQQSPYHLPNEFHTASHVYTLFIILFLSQILLFFPLYSSLRCFDLVMAHFLFLPKYMAVSSTHGFVKLYPLCELYVCPNFHVLFTQLILTHFLKLSPEFSSLR